NILDVVEKQYRNKESLIKYLLPYNDLLDRLVNKINKLQDTSQSLSEEVSKKDEHIHALEQTIQNQQSLLDGLFYNIIGSERELGKVMKNGRSRNVVTNYSLSETFGKTAYTIEV